MNNQPWFVNLVNTPTCKAFCRLAKENEWTGSMIRNPTYSEAYHIITCNVAENTLHGRYFEPGPNYREISIDEAILIISQPPNTEKILGITVEH